MLFSKRNFALLTSTLLLGSALTIHADGIMKDINAILNGSLTVTFNGQPQVFKDANGNVLSPITYNGSTYLPVRAISDLLDVPINYNSGTNTVELGTATKQPTSLIGLSSSPGTKYSTVIRDSSELTVVGDTAPMTFSTGVKFNVWNSSASSSYARTMKFNTVSYNELSFFAYNENESPIEVIVYGTDGSVITTFGLKARELAKKTLNIANVGEISFGANCVSAGAADGQDLLILDPVVE